MKKYYIIDVGAYSGGGEALFQLAADLLSLGHCACVAQTGIATPKSIPQKFRKYIVDLKIMQIEEIVDCPESVIIVPETATSVLFHFPLSAKYIWWLSYNYSDALPTLKSFQFLFQNNLHNFLGHQKQKIINYIRYQKSNYPISDVHNLAGSYYIQDCLRGQNINSTLFIHSIGQDFLDAGSYSPALDIKPRSLNVLYNPSKPSSIMNSLLRRGAFNYVPIIGMDVNQMVSLFRDSRLYIDFGPFPGPERLPKETCFNGCNIIVGNRNAAQTKDVQIPKRYKIDTNSPISYIEQCISDSLQNFYCNYHDFDQFRRYISNMYNTYSSQLSVLFSE